MQSWTNGSVPRLIIKDPLTLSNPPHRTQREPIPPDISAAAQGIHVLSQLSACPHTASRVLSSTPCKQQRSVTSVSHRCSQTNWTALTSGHLNDFTLPLWGQALSLLLFLCGNTRPLLDSSVLAGICSQFTVCSRRENWWNFSFALNYFVLFQLRTSVVGNTP